LYSPEYSGRKYCSYNAGAIVQEKIEHFSSETAGWRHSNEITAGRKLYLFLPSQPGPCRMVNLLIRHAVRQLAAAVLIFFPLPDALSQFATGMLRLWVALPLMECDEVV
jgi:hypothetical protein